jgi:ubiquinone/menaquinone biosynthesis C-methylase UbiE
MVARPPNPLSTSEPWDLVATGYAAEATSLMIPFSKLALELAGVGPTTRVLDVATGPGTLALLAAERVKSVEAVDFAESMIAELRRALAERKIENVRASVGDGQALSFADNSFDAAFSMFGLMFFPDRARGFGELLRVLAPGGVAVVSSWAPIDESTLMTLMFGAIRAADPSRPAPQKDLLSLENSELFEQELRAAGFTEVRVTAHEQEFPLTASADELWERMAKSSAPLVLMRRRMGEEQWAKQAEVARAHLRERLSGPSFPLTTKAYLGFGRKPRPV